MFFIVACAFIPGTLRANCAGINSAFTPSQTLVCGPGATVISFTNNSTGTGAAGALYTWYLNGVSFSNTFGLAAPSTSTISAVGTYNYMLVAHDTALHCRDTATVQVIIRPLPAAVFSFSPDNQCAGTTIAFTNASTGTGAFTTYSWNFGDGNTSATVSPTHVYAAGGSYNATLTITNGAGCTSTVSHTVTVMPRPVAAISGDDGDGDTQYCLTPVDNTTSDIVTFFNNTTGAVSYSWNFGDGSPVFNTTSTANFTHTYNTYGTYTVTMTATGANGCTTSTTLSVVFDKFVSASFSVTLAEFSGCVPHTVTPNNASQNASQYVWNFGDGSPTVTTTSFTAPSHTYTVGGSYTISVVASNSCNSSTSTVGPITVVGPPVINFTATPTLGCSPQTVTFGNTTTGASPTNNYYWDFGNGTTLNGVKFPPPQVYHQGTWTIMMVSGNACGTDTLFRTIVVDTIPTANMTATPLTGCTPLVVSTTNTSVGGNLSYQWYIDGVYTYSSATIPNQTFTAPVGNTAVNHSIHLHVSNHCGVDDTTVTITVHPLVTAVLTPVTSTICAGSSVTFTQSSKGDMLTYSWDFGNGNTSTSATPPAQTYATAGTYTVTLTVNGFCGTSTATGTVTVNPIPVAPTVSPATICSGTSATLTATAPGGTYQWYNLASGGTLLFTGASYTTPALTATTTYYVQTTVSGCTSPRTPVTVTVTPIPAAPTVTGTTICSGGTATLTPSAPGGTYQWYNLASGGTLLFTGASYTTPTLTATTTYYVSTTISGCTGARTPVTVTVNPIPAMPTAAPVTICSGNTATLTATAPGGTYQWYDSTTAGSLLQTGASYTTPVLTATHTYYVQTTVGGCTSPRRPVTVTVNPIPVADIVPDVSSGCSGLVVHFNDNSTLGGTYSWNFSGGTPGTSTLYTPPAVTFNTAGNNPVYFTVTVAGCVNRDTAFINISALPTPAFTMALATGCSPVHPVVTTMTGLSMADSFVWHLPGGLTSTAPLPPLPVFTATGTDSSYNIVLLATTTATGCRDSVTHVVTVHANPVASFTPGADTACANTSIAFTNSSTGGSTYQWTFGDAGTSTAASPSHTYTTPGNYTSQLVVSTAFACRDTATALIVIDSVPTAAFSGSTECLGFATQFTNTSTGSIVTWNWNFGDGSPAGTTAAPTHLYPAGGTYNVTLTVTNVYGCTSTVTHPVIVNPVPVAAFINTTACFGQATAFTDQTTGTPISWIWDFGDGSPVSNTHNPTHTYAAAGNYNVTLIAFGGSGCSDTVSHSITVNPVPAANFTFASVCTNDTMFFSSTSLGAPTTFSWNFGDSFSDNTNNPAPHHVYTTAGTYNVTLTAGYATGCTNSITIPVRAYPLTVPNFTATSSCLDVATVFTDASTGTPTQWSWNFGDASAGATLQNPSHTYAAPGTYPVKLVTQNTFGCRDSVTLNVTVKPLPTAAFAFDTVCNGTATAFSNQSIASASWNWDFGDGSPASTANSPTHTYASAGTYTVTLIAVTALGCTDTVTHSIVVNPNPVAAFTATAACFTYATVFTDHSTAAVSWSWNLGDGSAVVTTASPTYIYPAAGTYNVSQTVTNVFGCSNTITQPVVVKPVPVAAFTGTTECFGQSTVFTDHTTGAPISWSWDFGDATGGTVQNPSHAYAAAGTYNVTLIASGGSGCADTVSNSITVNPVPTANFTFASVCTNDTMFFGSTSLGTPDTFSWDFGDGFSDNTNNPSPAHVYSVAGTYNVTLTAGYAATGCTNSITIAVTAYPLTTPAFSSSTPCLNVATAFSDATTGTPTQWSWNFGDGSAYGTVQNPTHTYAAPGTYNVVLVTQNIFGCKDSVALTATVNPLPVAAFAFDTVCAGAATSFTDQSTAAVSWSWDFGDAATSNSNSPAHTYAGSGTYNVTLIVANMFGCTDTITHAIIVNPNPVSLYAATTACHTYPTQFSDQSTAAISWSWNYGDVTPADTLQSPTHIFANPGNYSVSLLVTNVFGCTNTSTQTVSVLPQPVADFNFNTVCARQSVQFNDATTGAAMTSWNWDFGDGTPQSSLQNPTHIYMLGGNYNVTLIAGNASGCADTIVKPVVVNTVPSPLFTATTACLGTVTSFTDQSTDSVAISTWFWDFNDGNNSVSQSPDYQYLAAGTFNVSLTVTNINGCDSSVTLPVTVNTVPVAAFSAGSVCQGGSTVFTDLSTGSPSQWSWNFNDGSPADNTPNPSHLYATPGTYAVQLTVSGTGCADSVTHNVVVAPTPVAAFVFDTVCDAAIMSLVNMSQNANTVHWDFGDGSPADSGNVENHTFPAAGTYNVTLIAANSNGCSDTVMHTVLVRPNPVALFTASTACYTYATTFTDNSTGASSWSWSFGDATAGSFVPSPSHTYPNPGNYNAWLTVTNTFGCSGMASQLITVNPQPVADFTYSRLCAEQSVQFTDATTGTSISSWSWNFGDGGTAATQDPVHTFAASGNYNVTLIAANSNGCSDTIIRTIFVNTVPAPLFTATTTCQGTATSFTDQSADAVPISSWYYDFGDGNNSASQNPSYIYAAAGTYNVSLTVTNTAGCDTTVTLPVTVNVFPVAGFTADTVCIGSATTFTDHSSGFPTSWSWNFGDGGTDTTGPVTTHTYAAPGSYVTSVTVSSGAGCTSQAFFVVMVRNDVHAGISAANSMCEDNILTINDNSLVTSGSIVSDTWDFGDGTTGAVTLNTSHLYPTPGTYVITHTVVSDGGCVSTAQDTVTVNPQPTAAFTTANICQSQPGSFTDNSTGPPAAWNWSFGDGGSSSIQNPTHPYATNGTFNTTLIVTTAQGCSDTITRPVTVYAQPVASFTSNVVCWGTSTSFTNSSTTATGTVSGSWWNFNDGGTATTTDAEHVLQGQSDSFNVTLAVITNFGCVDTVTQVVHTHPLPVFSFGPDQASGCDAFTTDFHDHTTVAGGSVVNWLWNFGDGNLLYTQNPTHTYDAPGAYYVSLTETDTYGCSVTDTLNYPVVVYPHPVAGFTATPSETDIYAPSIQMNDASAGATLWSWEFGDNETSIAEEPLHTYADTGSYIITQVAINQYGCRDTTEHTIRINGETTVFIPNAFTPDDNGLNDVFLPKVSGTKEFTMYIFDRWGNQIFKSTDMSVGWNGRVNNGSGEPVQQDVYVYKIITKDLFDNDHRYVGKVTVVR